MVFTPPKTGKADQGMAPDGESVPLLRQLRQLRQGRAFTKGALADRRGRCLVGSVGLSDAVRRVHPYKPPWESVMGRVLTH